MKLSILVGRNIRYYRYKNGYSQEKLSELCSISDVYVSEIERGKSFPHVQVLERIIDVLEVEPYKLFIEDTALIKLPSNIRDYKKVM